MLTMLLLWAERAEKPVLNLNLRNCTNFLKPFIYILGKTLH